MVETEQLSGWLGRHPEIIAALVLVAGWLIARILKHTVVTLVPWINRTAARLGLDSGPLVSPRFANSLQLVVFWGVLISSAILGLLLLSGGEVSGWLDGLLGFTAQFLVALGIIAVGHLLGVFVRSLVKKIPHAADGPVPQLAYVAVLGLSVFTALEHIGLHISFVTQVILVVISVTLAGLALAFAIGARTLVANLAAQGEIQRYKLGDRLIIDGVEGTILEIHRTGVVLATSQGTASIPAARFAETTVISVPKEDNVNG